MELTDRQRVIYDLIWKAWSDRIDWEIANKDGIVNGSVPLHSITEDFRKAAIAIDAALTERWISTFVKLPDVEDPVLVVADNGHQKNILRACWIPQNSIPDCGDYEGDCDYNEEEDQYFWPEGWYELIDNQEPNYMKMADKVTHWMPLPDKPRGEEEK